MDTVTATLKEQHTREAAQFMVTVAGLTLPAERRTLAKAYAEVMRHLETDREDLEEVNRLLRVAVKKVKTLTAEQQQAHVPAAGGAAGFQPRDIGPGGCWNCGSHGHRRFQCPVAPRGQGHPHQRPLSSRRCPESRTRYWF
jgi:dihydroxyacetone kinase